MKQTLPDIIRENDGLRQALLAQEGGIMKFWVQHPEADFDADLFEDYEKQIEKDFLQANSQNRSVRSVPPDELRRKALAWYLQSKGSELKFYVTLKQATGKIDTEVSEQILEYIKDYMRDAYKEGRRRKYPDGIPAQDFYKEIVNVYGSFGLALDCLERVLQEGRGEPVQLTAKKFFLANVVHSGESPEWKETNNLQTEFDLEIFHETYILSGGFRKLRQAVSEMIDRATRGMSEGDGRRRCCQLASDKMSEVNQFTRWVNNETYPMKETKDGKLVPLITPEERHWLRNIMYENSPGATGKLKLTTMGKHYSWFVCILEEIGRIWAAQLLVHGIDMRMLEKETGVVLSRQPDAMYYVDRDYLNDSHGDCCVFDWGEAKELLSKIKHDGDRIEEKRKAIMDYVCRIKEAVKDEFVFLYGEMWNKILSLESVKSKVYQEKHLPEGCIFKRNLVANIIHIMLEMGLFKAGTNVPKLTLLLEPDSDKAKNNPSFSL